MLNSEGRPRSKPRIAAGRWGFRFFGFRVWRFRVRGFWDLGFRVQVGRPRRRRKWQVEVIGNLKKIERGACIGILLYGSGEFHILSSLTWVAFHEPKSSF